MGRDVKYCPGLIHLRKQLRKLIAAEPGHADMIQFFDGEEWDKFPITEAGVIAASEMAPEIDGIVRYRVGDAVLQVIYDGPYDEDTAEEIINDWNTRAEDILNAE